jgi:hypothetical protein
MRKLGAELRGEQQLEDLGAFRLHTQLFAMLPHEIDRIRAARTGQRTPPRTIKERAIMYRFTGFLLLALASGAAFADTYQVTFGWTDPTPYIPSDAPTYEARYRVAGGTASVLPVLSTPGGSAVVTAAPGAPIDVSGRACNLGLCSAWTGWATATAPYPATQPLPQSGFSITVIRTGP